MTRLLVIGIGIFAMLQNTSQATPAKDSRGCVVPGFTEQAGVTIESTVPCVDGRNEGYGLIRVFRDGLPSWRIDVTSESGLIMRQGRIDLEWNPQELELKILRSCTRDGYVEAAAIVPDGLAVKLHWVAHRVYDEAFARLAKVCPLPRGSSYRREVRIYERSLPIEPVGYGGSGWPSGEVSCVVYGVYPRPNAKPDYGGCGSFNNHAYNRAVAEIQKEARALAAAAAKQAADEAERQKQAQIESRTNAFVKANRVQHFVTLDQLKANPFVFKGQVVAVVVNFRQMVSPSQAMFHSSLNILNVSGVPTGRFTRGGSLVLLAIRVLGSTDVSGGCKTDSCGGRKSDSRQHSLAAG
jgi:hypothetical protein